MAKSLLSLPMLAFLLLLTFSLETVKFAHGQKTWCVAKPSTDDAALNDNLHWACSQVDCSVLRDGCPCSKSGKLISHASVAMNLYYQSRHRNPWNCDFKGSALVTTTDPSFGDCVYPYY